MNIDYPVAFRLPKKKHLLAEDYLAASGEKNLNALAQKLLVAELEKRYSKEEHLVSKFDAENVEFLLAAVGNLREFFRRAFKLLFDPENAKDKYEKTDREMQDDWAALIQMFLHRTSAAGARADNFAADVEAEIDEIFDVKLIDSAPANFPLIPPVKLKNKSRKILKQTSLFD